MICGMQYVMHMHDLERMIEPGLNLEIQECNLKGGVILVENDINNAGIGVTIWK